MHYYQRHLGDYAASTAHLSMLEHGAYTLLLDHFYLTERPLTKDISTLARILRSTSKQEISAFKSILNQFWIETESGWVQHRAEDEMLKFSEFKAVCKSAGSRGGRPRKGSAQQHPEKHETVSKPYPFETVNGTETVHQRVTKANQEPIPNTHKPTKSKTTPPPAGGGPPGKPGDVSDSVWADFLALRKAKRAPLTATALSVIDGEARKAGVSLNAALVECCARGWQGFRADWMSRPSARASPSLFESERDIRSRSRREFLEQINGKHDNRCAVSEPIDCEAVRVD